jgi:hypothetical protein
MKVGEYVASMADAHNEPEMRAGERLGPTPERLRHARAAGLAVETWGSGEERQWRISPVLKELKRRKTISSASHAALGRFLREYYLGLYASPKAFGYSEKTSASANGSADYLTQRIHYARETERAILSIDPAYQEALQWVVSTLGDSAPLSRLGEHYAPGVGLQTQSAKAGMVLELLGAMLCRHYGIAHRLTIEQRIASLSQILLGEIALD